MKRGGEISIASKQDAEYDEKLVNKFSCIFAFANKPKRKYE